MVSGLSRDILCTAVSVKRDPDTYSAETAAMTLITCSGFGSLVFMFHTMTVPSQLDESCRNKEIFVRASITSYDDPKSR